MDSPEGSALMPVPTRSQINGFQLEKLATASERIYDFGRQINSDGVRPGLAQIFANALHPYLGSYVGAEGLAGIPDRGVDDLSTDELKRVFKMEKRGGPELSDWWQGYDKGMKATESHGADGVS